jgi:hypothetical protein
MSEPRPISFTTSPRLSMALHGSGAEFERAMESVGAQQTLTWLMNRADQAVDHELLAELVQTWFEATSNEQRIMPRAELAELMADADPQTAEILWEASMRDGFERNDGDQAFDAVSQLARLAEDAGDPLVAAEYYIEFLNWRRGEGHLADPESVHAAFEEIIRLANVDGNAAAAATFGHAHSEFARYEDHLGAQSSEGDWTVNRTPFNGWK